MPQVWIAVPEARVALVGAYPTPAIRAYGSRAQVEVTGFVEDLALWLRPGTVFAAPIFEGAGMRLKMLDALAAGMAVVATGRAARGLGAEDGRHLELAEDAAEFASSISRLLRDPSAARDLGERAQEFVVAQHSVARRAREREALWSLSVQGSRPSSERRLTAVSDRGSE